MKKIITFIFVFLFLINTVGISFASADNDTLCFYLEEIPDKKLSETVVTYICVKNNTGFNAVTLVLSFDPTKLTFIQCNDGNTVNYDNEAPSGMDIMYGPAIATGKQRILINKSGITDYTENGRLLRLEFSISSNAADDDSLSIDMEIPYNGRAVSQNETYVDAVAQGTSFNIAGKLGWKVEDGDTYYYYPEDQRVTGNYEIDGIMYSFSSTGVLQGKYTGLYDNGENTLYYKNGIKQTGFIKYDGNTYFFDTETGYMQTENGYCNGIYCTFDETTGAIVSMIGDVNDDGTVDSKDLVRLKKKLAGQNVEYNELNSDCNGDGSVNAKDLVRLKKKLAGQNVILGS